MQQTPWLRWPRIAWLILLPPLVAGVVLMKELGRRQRAAFASFKAANEAGRALGQMQLKQIKALYDQHRIGKDRLEWTPADLKREIPGANGGTHKTHYTAVGEKIDRLSFVDASSYWHFEFSFTDDRWTGFGTGSGGPPPLKWRWSDHLRSWHQFRKFVTPTVAFLWAGLVLTAIVWRNRRLAFFHGALMASITLVAIAEMHSGYTLFSTSNDNLWLSLVAAVVSVVLYVFARASWEAQQRRALSKGLCLICGYDLRASPERCPECGTPVPSRPSLAT